MITVHNVKTGPSREWGPNGSFTATVQFNGQRVLTYYEPGDGGPAVCKDVDHDLLPAMKEHFKTEVLPHNPPDGSGVAVKYDLMQHICRLVDEWEATKQVKRWCRTQVVAVDASCDKGEYRTFKVRYTPEVAAKIRAQHPEITEIVNERFL